MAPKNKPKKRKEKKRNEPFRMAIWIVFYVLVIAHIFSRYDIETEKNTLVMEGTLTNVDYQTGQAGSWFTFDLQGQRFYHVLQSGFMPVKEHEALLRKLEEDQTPVSIRYTKEKEWHIFHIGEEQAVQIDNSQTGEVYYGRAHHNYRELFKAGLYFAMATIGALLIGFWMFTDTFLHFLLKILPSKYKARKGYSDDPKPPKKHPARR